MAGMQAYPSQSETMTVNTPWGPAIPAANTAIQGAQNAYNTTYNGPLVAGMDPNVTAGQNQALGIAGKGATTNAATTGVAGVGGVLANGGIGAPMQYGIDTTKGAIANLQPIASGAFLTGNPYLDQIIDTTRQNITNDVNAQFSRAGRYGSGAYAGTLGMKLAQNEGNLRYQNFINQLQAMLGANSQIGSLAGNVAGIGQQGISNIYQGGNALAGYQNPLYADSSKQQQIGGARMDYEQAKIDAANQAPWTKVGNLAQIAEGIGGMGGTQWSTSSGYQTQPNQNQRPSAGQAAAGVGLGILGAAGNAGGFKQLFS